MTTDVCTATRKQSGGAVPPFPDRRRHLPVLVVRDEAEGHGATD
jgi:hypothetical protein